MTLMDKPDEFEFGHRDRGGAGNFGRPRFVSVFLIFWIPHEDPIDAEPLLGKNLYKTYKNQLNTYVFNIF